MVIEKDRGSIHRLVSDTLRGWRWWSLLIVNTFFLIVGQSAAVILGRLYYEDGGNSKWMATLVQTAAFPVLFIPLFLQPSYPECPNGPPYPSLVWVCSIYMALGVLIASDNMLYSVGLLYLSASTYSLICATQLAFNAIFSFFINKQKFTPYIVNSIFLLSLSASLIAIVDDSSEPSGVSKFKFALGFISTIGASALYSLILSLMQLTFLKVVKRETFSVALEMQIYTSLVATCICVVGLFLSGDWRDLPGEMVGFRKGRVSYVITLVGTALAWQVCSVGVVGLIFVVSSLFSNAISTVALALVPIASFIVFHDPVNGVKIVAILLAIWGFAWYLYQNYLDYCKEKGMHRVGLMQLQINSFFGPLRINLPSLAKGTAFVTWLIHLSVGTDHTKNIGLCCVYARNGILMELSKYYHGVVNHYFMS